MADVPHKKKVPLRAYAPIAGISAAVVAVVGLLVWFVASSMDEPMVATKKTVQQVTIIKPPPPPDTPPPPPPPPEEKVEVDEPEPEPEVADNDEPPVGDQLGLDADGAAGGDAFGLLARKGGRDLLAGGGNGRYALYSGVLKGDLVRKLSEIRDIRKDRYNVSVRLWLAPDGRVERYTLVGTTGKPDLDRDLRAALDSLDRVSERPPDGLPQPVRLRIVSRI
jgi:protein TonB